MSPVCRKAMSRSPDPQPRSRAKRLPLRISASSGMQWLNIVVQGVLTGGLYAMFAAGLSLIFGVMRLVNIAHGDLIVLAAYLALVTTTTLGIDPLLSILIVAPVMPAIAYALQKYLLNTTPPHDIPPPLSLPFAIPCTV